MSNNNSSNNNNRGGKNGKNGGFRGVLTLIAWAQRLQQQRRQ